jgi:hypothetical protein
VLHVTVPQIPGAKVRARRGGACWSVTARGVHAVQRLAVAAAAVAQVSEIDVRVESWKPPIPGWTGRPGLAGVEMLVVLPDGRGVQVHMTFTRPIDAGLALAAVVRCLRPVATGQATPGLTFTRGIPEAAAALAPAMHDVHVPDEQSDRHLRRCDVLIVGAGQPIPDIGRASTVVIEADRWTRDGAEFEVSVDPTIHRPLGRRSNGSRTVARGSLSGDTLAVTADGVDVRVAGTVSAANARALRAVDAILTPEPLPDRLHRQLSACGVLLATSADALPSAGDHLAWQAWSVQERRHALRQYGPSAALDAWPSVSIVLCTNRPDHLDRAMSALSGLRYPGLQVIIGAHGPAVDAARVSDMAQDIPHQVSVVAIDDSRNLGEALQACTDRAEGSLVTKMDDDDIYGPEHVWDLVLARQYSGAQLVGKALDWIHVESEHATVFRPVFPAEKYADFVAGGTILMSKADLMAVGGWRPVPKSVDRALLDRVLSEGGLVYRTHGLGYVYVRHSAGHTASVADEHFLTRIEDRREGLISHEAFGTAES